MRALDRQIGTLFYERLLGSQDKAKAGVALEAATNIAKEALPDPRDFIRDTSLKNKGFAFVSRQKHLRVESEDCFIDLKVGKLAHLGGGQMDMYVRVYDQQYRSEGDGPTLGLILCSERNAAVAKYSLLADKPQLFASKYQALIPTEAELQAELERDRAMLELHAKDDR